MKINYQMKLFSARTSFKTEEITIGQKLLGNLSNNNHNPEDNTNKV